MSSGWRLDRRGLREWVRAGGRNGKTFCSTWWSQRVHFGTWFELWPITLLWSVVLPVLGDKRRLHSSLAPAFPASLTQVLPPTQIVPLPPPTVTFLKPLEKNPDVGLGSPTRSIPLNRWAGELPHPPWHWRVRCCVEGACEGVDWNWDVELVGEEEQEVASVGYTFWIWFRVYDFYDLYDFSRSLFDWC